jgi:hypothetical protein
MRAVILLGFLALTNLAIAQSTSQTVADGTIHTRIDGISIPPIPNAPFTAKVVVTWDQPLVGGGTVSRKYYTLVARDSQGRVHREIRDFIPANSSADPPLRSFAITDPVGGAHVSCAQEDMSCTVVDFRAPLASSQVSLYPLPPVQAKGFTRESLGDQTMESMSVVGTREITTSNTGTRGNSRIVVSSKELWYSPDLQMYLSVVRKDPQLGEISLTVTNLLRGEPPPSWFSIPSGYTTVDARRNPSAAE